jgi:hypothetical protein
VQSPDPIVAARSPARRGRRWRGALAALLASALALGVLEATLRVAVNVPASHRVPGLWSLSRPTRFGDAATDDAYWEAHSLLGPAWGRREHGDHDARLGWRSIFFRAGDLEHVDEAALGERRPLLFFGDSYAEGIAPETRNDFPALFAHTELAREFAMLNYGVGGYGFDQIVLLLSDALARHAERAPVAIVSLLLDDDLDRCVLSFRSWPKPRLRLEDGRLAGADRPVPRMAEYFEQRSALEPLYLAPFLGTLWERARPNHAREREKQELARALLQRAVEDLRAAGVEGLFVFFRHGGSLDDPHATGWRRELCTQVLDGLGAAWVDVGPAFAAHRALAGRATSDYFLPPGHSSSGHYNALGDALAFEVVREGLRAHLGLGQGGTLLLAQDVRSRAGLAPTARWRELAPELEPLGLRSPFLDLDLDAEGRGALTWELRGAATALSARVDLLDCADGPCAVRLTAQVDGAPAGEWSLSARAPLQLVLELGDVRRLTLAAEASHGATRTRVVLSEVTLESACRIAPPLR